MANRNRTAGHNWEREVAKMLRDLFPDIATSRYSSREIDDSGVDFVRTGDFKFQAKSTMKAPSYHNLLTEMGSGFPVILHKLTGKGTGKKSKGKILIPKGNYAIMKMEHFVELLKQLKEHGIELERPILPEHSGKGQDRGV